MIVSFGSVSVCESVASLTVMDISDVGDDVAGVVVGIMVYRFLSGLRAGLGMRFLRFIENFGVYGANPVSRVCLVCAFIICIYICCSDLRSLRLLLSAMTIRCQTMIVYWVIIMVFSSVRAHPSDFYAQKGFMLLCGYYDFLICEMVVFPLGPVVI
jgi:hypothetical protein